MLAIEAAEIGGTLIALSVPGLKPLFDRYIIPSISQKSRTSSSGGLATYSSKRMGGAMKLGSGEDETQRRITARNRDLDPGDSDDSLVNNETQIHVRTSLHMDEHREDGLNIKMDSYPRTET